VFIYQYVTIDCVTIEFFTLWNQIYNYIMPVFMGEYISNRVTIFMILYCHYFMGEYKLSFTLKNPDNILYRIFIFKIAVLGWA
jgi:hypothetical protein